MCQLLHHQGTHSIYIAITSSMSLVQGLQSDEEYAAIVARSKWRKQRWAPSRILQARFVTAEAVLLYRY